MKKYLLIVLCIAAVAMPATAEKWNLDANHSKLKFAIDARMIGAEGLFHTYKVDADINEQALEQSKLELTIDMNSLDTNSEGRDKHLRTKDFFDVATYPTATIKVNSIKKIGADNYEGEGEITMHGVTKAIKLPARILLNEGGVLRFRGTLELNRKDFGMTYNSNMNKIEDVATVTYEFNLRKPRPQGAGGPPKQ